MINVLTGAQYPHPSAADNPYGLGMDMSVYEHEAHYKWKTIAKRVECLPSSFFGCIGEKNDFYL